MLYHPPLLPMPDLPVLQHCGAFGARRKFDIHCGVDLYAPVGENVYAIESGKVVYSGWFTGPECRTPWWNNTKALYVFGDTATIVYGEIEIVDGIEEGSKISMGQHIGNVLAVLKKDKGKPMSMLHLAMKQRGYDVLYDKEIYLTNLDPTPVLMQCKINSLDM